LTDKITATYYLDFIDQSQKFVDSVREFFSWATMGTSHGLAYIDKHRERSLRGSIINISPDPGRLSRGLVTYEFNNETFAEADLALLLSYLLYSSIQGTTKQLRLVDLQLPDWYLRLFPGPAFGSEEMWLKLKAPRRRPLFGVTLKPRQGLTPALAATIASAAINGGADYVIDDELLVDHPACPIIERVHAVVESMQEACSQRTRPALYVVNVTSGPAKIQRWLEKLSQINSNPVNIGIMVNGVMMGFPPILELRQADLCMPIVANTVASGMLVLSPYYNVSEHILVELSRVAGADAVYSIRHATQYAFDPSKIETLLSRLRHDLANILPAVPVFAGGISLGTILRGEVPQDPDFMIQSGSTICGYEQDGLKFPGTIIVATEAYVEAIRKIYLDGLAPSEVASDLAKRHLKRNGLINLRRLGINS
jgi:ribulose 1,5-bisphosphate carboxylase large subunit-like protein